MLDAAEFAAVIAGRVNREYEGMIKSGGDTVHVPRLYNLTAQTKSLTTGLADTVVWESATATKQDISINTMQYAAFLVEDAVEIQSNVDLRSKWEKKIGYALARAREVALAALAASFSVYTGTLGVELTEDDYLYMWQKFAEAGILENSPDAGEDFSIFLNPAAYAALMKIDAFTSKDYNENAKAVSKMSVGDIYGFRVLVSNLITANGTGHDCFACHRSGMALCVQNETPVKSQYMINNLGDGVVGYNIYGVAEINFNIETAGSVSTSDNRDFWLKTV